MHTCESEVVQVGGCLGDQHWPLQRLAGVDSATARRTQPSCRVCMRAALLLLLLLLQVCRPVETGVTVQGSVRCCAKAHARRVLWRPAWRVFVAEMCVRSSCPRLRGAG